MGSKTRNSALEAYKAYKSDQAKSKKARKKKKKEAPKKPTGTQRHRSGKAANTSKGDERRGKEYTVKRSGNTARAHGANPSGNRTVRTGVNAARNASKTNPVTQGVRYIANDKAKPVFTAPTKIVAGTLKNSQNRAGTSNRHKAGTTNTRRTDRLTEKGRQRVTKIEVANTQRKQEINQRKSLNDKQGYSTGDSVIRKSDATTKKLNKYFEREKEDALKKGASGLSDTKHDIPIYTKWAKNKATDEAKKALKEAGVTRAKTKKDTTDWLAEQEKKYDLKDDTVLDDGTTWAEYKRKTLKDADDAVLKQQAEYIKNATKDAGKMSAQDLYKAGVPLASEMIDYAIPYMGTAKGSIKVAEKILEKATKAGKAGKAAGKTVPKVEKAVDDLVKNGQLTPDAAKVLNRKIKLRSGVKSVSKEALANALQDATIGTALDLGKGINEGYKGEELESYMKQNALMNLAIGAPISAVAGKAGAKEARNALADATAKQINDLTNLTKPDAIKLENLLKKQEKGTLSDAESKTLSELQNKALGGGTAVVNRKGQIEVNKAENAIDDLSKTEVAEYYKLRSQATRGTLDPRDTKRFNELNNKVQTAYKRTESAANEAINIKGKAIRSRDQSDLENAVRFFERTGDKTKLEQAQKSLEIAKDQTRKLNDSLGEATNMMTEKTGINYKWVDDEEMFNLTGQRGNQGYTDPKTGEVIINRDSPQAWQAVLGHETGHVIKMSNEDAFRALGDELETYARELGEFEDLDALMRRNYPEFQVREGDSEAVIREKEENFREEMVSEMIGRYIFGEDDKYLKKLAGEQPTTLQRIVAYIRQLISNTKNKELAERLTKMQDDALNAIDEAKKTDWKERGLKEVTGKEKEEYIKKSQLAPVSGEDGMYSYAYEAAAKLGKSVKSDSDSLLKYFQKKGVTAEEMKWTGLGDFIRENSPLSRQQLLDFIVENDYELHTIARGVNETRWGQYSLRGGSNYREYEYIDPRLTGYSNDAMGAHWGGNKDVVVHSRIQDFHESTGRLTSDSQNIAQETSRAVQELAQAVEIGDKIDIKIGKHEFHGEPRFDEEKYRIVHVDDVGEIADIKEFSYGQNFSDDFFRDLLYTEPEAYTNGGKVLHVEEIQSDWHNAGQKSGYTSQKQYDDSYEYASDMKQNAIDSFTEHMEKWQGRKIVGRWSGEVGDYEITVRPHRDMEIENMRTGEIVYDMKLAEGTEVDDFAEVIDRLRVEDKTSGTPEAPYKNTYTDYAMKRALREAVEDDYDVITWTTAKQQSDRWSDEFAEGYRIEYDQDIPSFMRRYVKQWGGEVEKVRLAENGEEVWGVRITDEMRESIKRDGQRRFSRAGKNAEGVDRPMAELAESLYDGGKGLSRAEIKRLTGWDVDTDGKAKFEFSDKDMKLKLKMKDIKDMDEARLEDVIEHGEMFKYYPKFKNISVQFVKRSEIDAEGEFLPIGDGLLYVAKGQTKAETENTILHELQHAIQSEEEFAGGASPEFYEEVWGNMTEELNKYKKDLPNGVNTEDYAAIDLIRMDDGIEAAEKYEKILNARNELRGQFKGYGFRGNKAADKLVESGKIPYKNTKGEIEARQTEARRNMTQEELDANPREVEKNEIMREDYDNAYDRKFSRSQKSLYNYSGEKPKSKLVEKANKLQDENNAQIRTMTTSNDANEVKSAVLESDRIEGELEKLGSKPRREVPTEEKTPEPTKETTSIQKMRDSEYVSKEVKTALDDIEKAGVYTKEAEKAAKKYTDLDGKIAGVQGHLNNAKKKEYPTQAEKDAHIADLEDDLRVLKNEQKKVAKEIEDMGRMRAPDPNKTWEQERDSLQHNMRKVNRTKDTEKLKSEDNWIQDKIKSIRRLGEDSLIEVESTAKGRGVSAEDREELLTAANRVRNSEGMTNSWVTKTRKTFDNQTGGKCLDEIFPKSLIKNEEKYADFQEYLIMKHAPARHAKGTDIYPDLSPEKAKKIADGLEEKYGKELTDWADDVYAYLKDLQQYRVDSGLLAKEAADQFAKDYPFYVPTNRARDDEPIQFFTGGLSNQIRTARGGESPVLDMYSQLYTATSKTIHAAEENQMLNVYFRAKGVSKEALLDTKLPDLEHAAINATVNKKTGASKISFFVDGTPVEYACSHQLALGIREMDGLEFERLMKAAKLATLYGKPFKALITDWNIVFGLRNGARDMQQALVNTKDLKYFGSSFGAASHAIIDSKSPYRAAYASMGGERAQLVSYDAVAQRMGLEKGKIDKYHEGIQDFVDASIKIKGKDVHVNVLHYIESANGAIEMMPRMCEFIGTLRKEADKALKAQGKKGIKELREQIIKEVEAEHVGQSIKSAEVENRLAKRVLELAGKDGIDSAMRNANDITLNFGRSGVVGKMLNLGAVPYLNPSIQGLSKLARMFTENGAEGGVKALASLGMKFGLITIAPTVWNELALKDDEYYQSINTRDKDNNFFIPLGDGKYIKFPKPRENAVLAEPVEYALRYNLDKTEYAFFDFDKLKMENVPLWEKIPLTGEGKQAFRTALDNIGVINPATSNMVSPLWQTFNNKTWYGGSIESAYETSLDDNGNPRVPVKDRKDSGTTALAIWLGKTRGAQELNLSPKKIDNILDSYTGMIYDLGLSQTTEEARSRGNYFVRTIASQFTKDAVFSNKLSTKAWDKLDGMSKAEQDKFKGTYMYDTYKYDDAMDMITSDKNMTDQEKMAAKRALQKQKNKLNRAAIEGTENKSNPLVDISKYLGATKTLENFLPEQKDEKGRPVDNDWESYFKNYEAANGYDKLTGKQKDAASKAFLQVYSLGVKGQKIASPDFHHDEPKWTMTGVAIAQSYKNGKINEKQADLIANSCSVWEKSRNASNKYVDFDGHVIELGKSNKCTNKVIEKLPDWGIKETSGLWKGGFSKTMNARGGTIAMALASDKETEFKDRSYYIEMYDDPMCMDKMNAARGFKKRYKHKTKEISQLALQADAMGDSNTYLKNDEIVNVCSAQEGWSDEERSMGYILLGGNPKKNPFGAIGDYSIDGDTGIEADDDGDGKGGRGRRRRGRRGRRGGGGGGGGGSTPFTPVVNTAGGAAKQKITNVKATDVFKSSDYTRPSNLNDAYRKRARKLREQTRKHK